LLTPLIEASLPFSSKVKVVKEELTAEVIEPPYDIIEPPADEYKVIVVDNVVTVTKQFALDHAGGVLFPV